MSPDGNTEKPNLIEKPKPQTPTRTANFRQKLAGIAKATVDNLIVTEKKVPVEEITTDKIADTILNKLGNPLQERMGQNRYANPFDITSVITELGYVGVWSNTDYLRKFPQVYNATRQALFTLEQEGVLESRDFEEPNVHGETKYYKVTDAQILSNFVTRAKNTE